MARKIIDREKFSWREDDRFRLNYQMIFEDQKDRKSEPAGPDVGDVLKNKEAEWNQRLEKARSEAYEQGLEKGLDQGRREGLETARMEIDARIGTLEKALIEAREEHRMYQNLLKPGLLNLVFEIAEAILAVPITNGTMRNKLEEELTALFQELDTKTRPVLWVSADDYDFVESLIKKLGDSTGITIRMSKHCNPGEYQLETNREKIVRDFRQMLNDFKESLILPK
jgi:flagellar biosynthesis/type III secretory pathway protein FliH